VLSQMFFIPSGLSSILALRRTAIDWRQFPNTARPEEYPENTAILDKLGAPALLLVSSLNMHFLESCRRCRSRFVPIRASVDDSSLRSRFASFFIGPSFPLTLLRHFDRRLAL